MVDTSSLDQVLLAKGLQSTVDISPASSLSASNRNRPGRKSRSYAQTIIEGYQKQRSSAIGSQGQGQGQTGVAGLASGSGNARHALLPPMSGSLGMDMDAGMDEDESATATATGPGLRRPSNGGRLRKMKSFYERRLEKETAATYHVVEKLEAVAQSLNAELQTLRMSVYGVEEDDNLGIHQQEIQDELESKMAEEEDPSRLLLKAAVDGNLALCLKLLTQYSVEADITDRRGCTPLGHLIMRIERDELYYDKKSCRRMLKSIIEQLIYNGANVNKPCPNGKSPFWIVADENELDLMRVMIEAPRPYVENGKSQKQKHKQID